ncbi:MAG: hypothetical protein ACR2NU_09920 [Aeoliella sp.]
MKLQFRMDKLGVLIGMLVVAVSSTSAVAQEPPVWKLTVGELLRYELVQTTQIDVDAGNAGSFSTLANQTLDVVWKISKVGDDGAADGVQQIERIQVSVTMPDGLELVYDSSADEPPTGVAAMLSPLYAALLEEVIPITVAADGELVRFEPSEETTDRITGVPATRAMGDLVAGTGLRQIAEQVAFGLSARPIEVKNRVLGTLRGEVQWRHQGQTHVDGRPVDVFQPQLSLAIEPSPPLPDDAPPQPDPISSPKIEKQTALGEAVFDLTEGKLERSMLRISLTITGEVTGAPVTSVIEQTIEVQRKTE